jgi:transposase-like protein
MPRTKDFAKRQLWKNRLAQFQASRLSVAQFCRSVGCSAPSFYQWRRKLEGTRSLPPFLEIQTPDHRAPTIEVKLPSGISILLPVEALDSLAQILERVA